jgi:hypothetical protein
MSCAKQKQQGQALIFVTLSLPVIMGLAGFAVDLSWFYFRKEAVMVAAQAAALAGATQVYKAGGSITCNSVPSTPVLLWYW